jgi:hypothetical protein
MARPLTRNQILENRAFLKALEQTGNIREAVRETGLKHSTMFHRRKHHPAFAQRWDAAVTVANARLAKRGGPTGPSSKDATAPHRTQGGEAVVVRRRDGKLQVRRAQPGKITQACEQAFLAALSATANVRLSAAAVGVSPRAFYRRQCMNPGFAREMRLAITMGYERLELALLENMDPREHADDAWRHNDPPPIPPMSVEQAIQLMYHHRKTAQLWAEHPQMRRRPGESREAMSMRLSLLHEARMEREREKYRIAEAARRERGEPSPFEPAPPALPDLAQVTGWSKASGKPAYGPEAGFGGWRIEHLRKKRGE